MEITERQAVEADENWIWLLYVNLLKGVVTAQWGWDETFQVDMFRRNLPYSKFRVLEDAGYPIAAYAIAEHHDHTHLRMLLVDQKYQRRGVGKHVMYQLMNRAAEVKKTIRLSVIKANPVSSFYISLGLKQTGEDDSCYLFSFDA